MPKIGRRSFLKYSAAAAASPLLPALPAREAIAGQSGMSASKALWASLYANSGTASNFVKTAQSMGLSNSAIQGVSARSIGVKLALSTQTNQLAAQGVRSAQSSNRLRSFKFSDRIDLKKAVRKLFEEQEEPQAPIEQTENTEVNDDISSEPPKTQSQ